MIRDVRREDLPECACLIRKSFMTVAEEFGMTEKNAPRFTAFAVTEEKLRQQLEDEHRLMFVWEENGTFRGYCSLCLLEDRECELNHLAVLPEYRRNGIGKKLLEHAITAAGNAGCSLMKIGIVEENKSLRSWYEQNGFVHTGTRKFDFFPFTCGYMNLMLTKG